MEEGDVLAYSACLLRLLDDIIILSVSPCSFYSNDVIVTSLALDLYPFILVKLLIIVVKMVSLRVQLLGERAIFDCLRI